MCNSNIHRRRTTKVAVNIILTLFDPRICWSIVLTNLLAIWDVFCSYISVAYIPLQCKTTRVGPPPWSRPPTQPFRAGDTNMLVSKKPTPSFVDPTPSLADPTPSLADLTPSLVDPTSSLAYPTRASGIYFALGPLALGLHWPCRFHVVFVNFICIGRPTQTQFLVEYGLIPPS